MCFFTWWNTSRAASQNWVSQWRKVKCSVDTCNTCVRSKTHAHFFCTPALRTYASNLSVTRWNTLDLLWISWNTQAHCKAQWGDVVNHLSSALTEVEGLNSHTWSCFVGNICSLSPGWCNQGGGDVSEWLHTCSHTHTESCHIDATRPCWAGFADLRVYSLKCPSPPPPVAVLRSAVNQALSPQPPVRCPSMLCKSTAIACLTEGCHTRLNLESLARTHTRTDFSREKSPRHKHTLTIGRADIWNWMCAAWLCCIFFLLLWWHGSFS